MDDPSDAVFEHSGSVGPGGFQKTFPDFTMYIYIYVYICIYHDVNIYIYIYICTCCFMICYILQDLCEHKIWSLEFVTVGSPCVLG